MPKIKKGSPEAKERMAKARAARIVKDREEAAPSVHEAADVKELLKRIEELEQRQSQGQGKFFDPSAPVVTPQGIVGILEKYSVDPKRYPDPTARIFEFMQSTRALREHNFNPETFLLTWEVQAKQYTTFDGRSIKEPRFAVEMWRYRYVDKDGNEHDKPIDRYKISRFSFYEDPQAALDIANEHGHSVPDNLAEDFLNEMRYLRIQDWIVDVFTDPRTREKKEKLTNEVIGNVLVDVVEISSGETSSIPFDKLKNKL